MSETRVCHWCNRTVPINDYCPDCVIAFVDRPDVSTMTKAERIAELRWFLEGDGQYVEIAFDDIHGRIEALMGRPVWTHEMAASNAHVLISELANGVQTNPFNTFTMPEVIAVVVTDSEVTS